MHKLPNKFVKLASDISSESLSIAINNSTSTTTFPNNAKTGSAVPIDKKTDDKYVISNFRPVNILNLIKNELTKSMNVQ